MRRALKRTPSLCVVIVAENESVEAAVEAMREGAYDVLVRPLRFERLLAVLRRGTERQALESRVAEMEGQLDERLGLERLTGPSRAIHRVLEQVRAVASTRAAVLIEGEPGTGKRLVAQTIHRNGPRRDERFVWANCSAPAAAVEGDLFGYEAAAGVAARPGDSSWPTAARCSSTRSATRRPRCRCDCCAPCRNARSSASADALARGRRAADRVDVARSRCGVARGSLPRRSARAARRRAHCDAAAARAKGGSTAARRRLHPRVRRRARAAP
jgi:hypothetical protein